MTTNNQHKFFADLDARIDVEVAEMSDEDVLAKARTLQVCLDFTPGAKRPPLVEIARILVSQVRCMEVYEAIRAADTVEAKLEAARNA